MYLDIQVQCEGVKSDIENFKHLVEALSVSCLLGRLSTLTHPLGFSLFLIKGCDSRGPAEREVGSGHSCVGGLGV